MSAHRGERSLCLQAPKSESGPGTEVADQHGRNICALRQSDGTHREHRTNLSASTVVEGLGIGTSHGPLPLAWKRLWCHPGDAARHLPYRQQAVRALANGTTGGRAIGLYYGLWAFASVELLWGLGPCPLGPWFDRLPGCSIGPKAAHGAIDHGRLVSDTIDDPARFARSRSVGAYVGLTSTLRRNARRTRPRPGQTPQAGHKDGSTSLRRKEVIGER